MALLLSFFKSEIDELDAKNVRILILGDKDPMPAPQREALYSAERRTAGNTGLKLCIAVNYGSRAELARAARLLAKSGAGTLVPRSDRRGHAPRKLYTPAYRRGSVNPHQRGDAAVQFCCAVRVFDFSFGVLGPISPWKIFTPASPPTSAAPAASAADRMRNPHRPSKP
jgi:hypothetical protein